jgi:hypothetical protein
MIQKRQSRFRGGGRGKRGLILGRTIFVGHKYFDGRKIFADPVFFFYKTGAGVFFSKYFLFVVFKENFSILTLPPGCPKS